MYRIIGADKNEYGPVTAEQMRQWMAEGRVNGETMVRAEGTSDWKPLSQYPELLGAGAVPPISPLSPPPSPAPGPVFSSFNPASDQVSAPATGLIITAILGFLAQVAGLAAHFIMTPERMGMTTNNTQLPSWVMGASNGLTIVQVIIAVLAGVFILYGGLQMKKLQNYSVAMGASIVAMVPCISPCCLVGLPIGIWALVVLNKPEVKSSFQ